MKKSVYMSGIAVANLMMFGCLFKVQHWPGANVLICLAVFLFCFFFLPAALLSAYQNTEHKERKALYIVTFIVFSISIMGALFKIMHWPGASFFLLLGLPLPFILFLPVYLYQTRKDPKNESMNYLGIMFGMTFLAVFSVLLSLNVSRIIIECGLVDAMNNEKIIQLNKEKIEKSTASNEVTKKADELCSVIDDLNMKMAAYANGREERSLLPLDLSQLKSMDNPSITSFFMFSEGSVKMNELKEKIDAYRNALINSGKNNPALNKLAGELFDTNEKIIYQDQPAYPWDQSEFRARQLILVIDQLLQIESNVRLTEAEYLSSK